MERKNGLFEDAKAFYNGKFKRADHQWSDLEMILSNGVYGTVNESARAQGIGFKIECPFPVLADDFPNQIVCWFSSAVLDACAQDNQDWCQGAKLKSIILNDALDAICGTNYDDYNCPLPPVEPVALEIKDQGRFIGSDAGTVIICAIELVLLVFEF